MVVHDALLLPTKVLLAQSDACTQGSPVAPMPGATCDRSGSSVWAKSACGDMEKSAGTTGMSWLVDVAKSPGPPMPRSPKLYTPRPPLLPQPAAATKRMPKAIFEVIGYL